jgi:hypothetical protein
LPSHWRSTGGCGSFGLVTAPLRKGPPAAPARRYRNNAWAALCAAAVVVTGYLAWGAWRSAGDPAWLYLDGAWWRAWLRPDRDTVPLLFAALWLATALAYWWPRRRRLPDVGLVIIAAMVAIGAVLGTASLAPCRGGQSRSAVAAWVLSLYVGALEPRYGPGLACAGPLPLALQVGRTVCLGATFVGAIVAAAVLWRQPAGRLRASLVKDATILTGLDAMTIPLLHRLTAAGRPSSVVVIEPDHLHPLLDEARATGAQIVVADPRSEQVLLPMVRGLRGPQLRYLFALRAEVAENEAVLAAAGKVLSYHKLDADQPPHLIARIDDPRHVDVWRGRRIGTGRPWFEDALSPQESTARTLVDRVARTGAEQVLLCADSALALTVLLELARHAWERQGRARAVAQRAAAGHPAAGAGHPAAGSAGGDRAVSGCLPGRVVLLDARAEDLLREYRATSPRALVQALPEVSACTEDWRGHLLAMLDAMPPGAAAKTAVLITQAPSEASLHEAGRVARLHPATAVFILTPDAADVTDAVYDRLQPFARTLLAGGQVPEDSWTRIARHWHETYRLAHPAGATSEQAATRRPWDELDDFTRQDNILQLRSVMAAVARSGRRWVPVRAVPLGSMVELTDGEVRRVAMDEHTRWYERRQRARRPAPAAGGADGGTRVDSTMRPWPDLPGEAREQACRRVRGQLQELEDVGFLPVVPEEGPPGAALFRRVGEVRAEQLSADRAWRSPAGDTCTGSAGDWLVIDESGQERTVRNGEFHASHEPLGGGRWQRTGTVLAWQVEEATVIRTLEGNAVAEAGDRIVQGPARERWPVKHDQFTRGYVPVRREAAGG